MNNILLQKKIDTIANTAINNNEPLLSIWLWIALIEFMIIVFLIVKLKKKQHVLKFENLSKEKMKSAKESEIDMTNLMNSINKSKELYKELSRYCHPDRYINTDKQKTAEEIFQEISKHKRDFKKLSELKEKATDVLNINFK
jgi:uncharacterized protein YozE (UPF0346 family)